jgi:cation transport ATPase
VNTSLTAVWTQLLEDVDVGDRMKVRPGKRIPTDGVVLDGQSAVDTCF